MNNLLEQMAKASWKAEVRRTNQFHTQDDALDRMWDAPNFSYAVAYKIADMKAALQMLGVKLLPNEFCQHFKADSVDIKGYALPVDTIQCAFKYAINQTLKDDEDETN